MPARLEREGFLDISGQSLEYRHWGPAPDDCPALMLLHEGLGSVGLWRDFPQKLAEETGFGVFAYSRAGYGRSSPVALPRPLSYMHYEAREILPAVLDRISFRSGVLVGHSDGASIAAIYTGTLDDPRIKGLSLIAPHFVVEDVTVASIAEARIAYEGGDLRKKLSRWHEDVDNAFWGWNRAWLDPDFRGWDITEALPGIAIPVQIVQGNADPYGTAVQVELAEEKCGGPVEVVWFEGAGHSPPRDQPEVTLERIAAFARAVLGEAPFLDGGPGRGL